jgi:dTDP-4-amino-4,6-dideoxygalactose transaminase
MEFIDLKAQYKHLKNDIYEAIANVLDKGDYILGSDVHSFEEELCAYTGRKYCVSVANGTDAIVLALRVLGVGSGDAVFVPDFTYFATAEAVSIVGATPVFVDVDQDTLNIDPKKLEDAITQVKRQKDLLPKAIIPVDLFGLPYNVPEITAIAEKHKLYIIEDAAQGFGGEYDGRKACSFGDIATTSFFPAKPLGCYGDGGAVLTDNLEYYERLLSLRVHGKGEDKYDNIMIGYNSRLDTIQAAILRVKLRALNEHELSNRQKFASVYNELFLDKVKVQYIPNGYLSSYAQYTIILKDQNERDKVQDRLKKHGIPSCIYYVKGLHMQTAYKTNPSRCFDATVSESLTKRALSLPMHPYMTNEQIQKICNAVLGVVNNE